MEQGKQENTPLNTQDEKEIKETQATEQNVTSTEENSVNAVPQEEQVTAPKVEENPASSAQTNIFGQEVETTEAKEEQQGQQEQTTSQSATTSVKEETVQQEQPVQPQPNVEIRKDVQVVYEYKPKKDYGIWPILAFFILIAGIIFALPSIQKLVNDYRNSGVNLSKNNNTPTEPTPSEETPQEEVSYFDFNGDTTVSINKLTLNNFSKEVQNGKHYLSLTVLNKDNRAYNYSDKIYIELYNANDTLLSRSLLESSESIAASSSSRVNLLINEAAYSGVAKFLVKTIVVDDYPQINLAENLKDQEVLTCTLDNQKNVYTFKEYKLVSIDSTLNFLRTSYLTPEAYASALATYRQTSATYGLINGVSSSIVDAEDGFTLAIKIDSKTVSIGDLNEMDNRAFYEGNTLAKEVAFEMAARGYICN